MSQSPLQACLPRTGIPEDGPGRFHYCGIAPELCLAKALPTLNFMFHILHRTYSCISSGSCGIARAAASGSCHLAGYECQEADGDFMLVFENPVQAVNFCLQVWTLLPSAVAGSIC